MLVTDYQHNMSTESTEPSTTPPGPMSATSREVEEPTTKKATKSKTKPKTKRKVKRRKILIYILNV